MSVPQTKIDPDIVPVSQALHDSALGDPAPVVAPELPSGACPAVTYSTGTLRYTRRELAFIFVMLLGGDFAFTFFEAIFGRVLPLLAKDFHGSNTLIGIMTGSIAGLMNLFVLPNLSMRSDRHRGRLGRRIPYLLWSTPCTVASLLLVGFAPEIGAWLRAYTPLGERASEATIVLGLLCVFVASYHLWNMVLNNVYVWLIRDVVPGAVIGRFLSWFRVVATLASFGFLWWVFPHIMTHRKTVFVAVSGAYLVIFLLMCWQVREGGYPPPAADVAPGLLKTFARYFRECLGIPIYRNYFFVYVLMTAATSSVGPFTTLFARDTLGLELGDMGKIAAWGTLAGAFIFVPMGWLSDKFKPVWIVMGGLVGIVLMPVAGYFLVHDRTAWWVYSLVGALPSCAWSFGNSAFTMTLFPVEEFGQFSAGLNVFGFGGLIIGNYLLGVFMDAVHSHYQYWFLWTAVLTAAALVPMSQVIRGWHAHGGPHHYLPPLPPTAGHLA
ncbi:MAG: hypothetical protein INR62_05825 [Rhodospirillales bacterium]|nr:hypothetical protein [Acetobacter sp.]